MCNFIIDKCGVKRTALELKCENCQCVFLKQKKDVRNTNFCSKQCYIFYSKRTNVVVECAWCRLKVNRTLSSLQQTKSGLRFCSIGCKNKAQSLSGLSKITPSHYGNGNHKYQCEICGKKTHQKKYCAEHGKQVKYEDYIAKWQSGEISGNVCNNEKISSHIRRYMFEKHNFKCQKCSWSQIHSITGKIPLTINHIDGNCTNSKENNLELLCPNCHSLTPNYGSLNKGNGRRSRRN